MLRIITSVITLLVLVLKAGPHIRNPDRSSAVISQECLFCFRNSPEFTLELITEKEEHPPPNVAYNIIAFILIGTIM